MRLLFRIFSVNDAQNMYNMLIKRDHERKHVNLCSTDTEPDALK